MQKPSKNAVYSPQWQMVRMQLKGNWVKHLHTNIMKCNAYIEIQPDINRLWRVLNLLNGVRMGFSGMGISGTLVDRELGIYRDQISEKYHELKNAGAQFEEVTEDQVLDEWAVVPQEWRDLIIEDLSIRYLKSGKSSEREDLKWFLHLIGVKV